jgi:hypothetical protein
VGVDGFVGVDEAFVVFGAGAGASEVAAGAVVLGLVGVGVLGVLLDSAFLESVR